MNDFSHPDDDQPAPHPGKLLREDFLEPMRISPTYLARHIGVPIRLMHDIVAQRASIDADMALRLARYFRTTPQFWAQMQANHDLDQADREHGARIRMEIRPWHELA